jgi:hypothetical protein
VAVREGHLTRRRSGPHPLKPHPSSERAIYRISRSGHEPIMDVDQVEAIKPAIRSSEPGRYHVDEISADLLPSGHSSRRWGVGIWPDSIAST